VREDTAYAGLDWVLARLRCGSWVFICYGVCEKWTSQDKVREGQRQ